MADEKYTVSGKVKFTEDTKPAFDKVKTNLREMGEKISSLGMRITAITTVPVIGLVAGLNSIGAAASKTVSDLKGNQAAINALDPAVRSLAKSYDEMQAMIAPVKAEFQAMAATLMRELVPIMKEMMPTIRSVVDGISGLVKSFAAMPISQQQTILGFIAVGAAIGPVVTGIGQIVWGIGTITTLAPGLTSALKLIGTGAYAALGPVGLLAAAIAGVIALMNQLRGGDWFNQGLQAGGMLLTGMRGAGQFVLSGGNRQSTMDTMYQTSKSLGIKGYANGGYARAGVPIMVGERGPEPFIPSQNGNIIPSGRLGTTVIIDYHPAVALSSRDEAETVLGPMIANYLHRSGR